MALQNYSSLFKASLIPEASNKKYKGEFKKFEEFLTSNGTNLDVNEEKIESYVVFCLEAKHLKASTVKTYASIIKAVTLTKGYEFSDAFWKSVFKYIGYKGKNIKQKQAPEFLMEDLLKWFNESVETNFCDVQSKIAAVIAFSGALRSVENYKLLWDDVEINLQKKEVKIMIKVTKTGVSRSFVIKENKFFNLFIKYREEVGKQISYLYPAWNVRYAKFSNQRRGMKFFQQLPKRIAEECKLSGFKSYTHHSFRRGAATTAFENGSTMIEIKSLGGWKSSKSAEKYIANSIYAKRKMADMLSLSENEEKIEPPKRKKISKKPENSLIALSKEFKEKFSIDSKPDSTKLNLSSVASDFNNCQVTFNVTIQK